MCDLEAEIAAAQERQRAASGGYDAVPRSPEYATVDELEAALVEDLGIDVRTALVIKVVDAGRPRAFFTYKQRHWELVLLGHGKSQNWNLTPPGRQMIVGVPRWQLRERLLAALGSQPTPERPHD